MLMARVLSARAAVVTATTSRGTSGRTSRAESAPGADAVNCARCGRGSPEAVALGKPALTELADPRGVRAQPPEDPAPLAQKPPAQTAGGVPAIVSTVKHALGEAGLVRGTRLLARLNQFDGFDCPGCAWPEP